MRSSLISHARGQVKSLGSRLPSCDAAAFARKTIEAVPALLREGLEEIYDEICALTIRIKRFDRKVNALAVKKYPETLLLTAIKGVGKLTALAFILTLQSHARFRTSRSVGAFCGLVPRVNQSGDFSPELRISKAGSPFLRRLLCQAAQYILGPFGDDCDLRRYGLRIAGSDNKTRKRKAVIAVCRKLAVLMHRLWSRGEVYDPLYNTRLAQAA
jgi:transposase